MTIVCGIEPIYKKSAQLHCMNSDVEREVIRQQVDIYRQLKEQLVAEMRRLRKEGKPELAEIISKSVAA